MFIFILINGPWRLITQIDGTWLTSGHSDCMSFNAPIQERQTDANIPFHWADFHAQNLLAKAIVERAGYIYMTVDSMLSLRPDGHVAASDCLHYCLPGPLDSVINLFYNIRVVES